MNISLKTAAIAALAITALSAGSYLLVSSKRDAITAQMASSPHTVAVSGHEQPNQVSRIAPSASHEFGTEARLQEFAHQIGALRGQSDTTTQSADERINQLALEITSLRRELGHLADELAENSEIEVPVRDDEELDLSEKVKEERVIQEIEDEFATYDEVGRQEGSDGVWSADAQAQLYESFLGLNAQGIGVSDVICYSSFCKTDFSIDSDNANEAMRHLQDVAPWGGESVLWINDVEQGTGVMYVAREGETLPQIGEPDM